MCERHASRPLKGMMDHDGERCVRRAALVRVITGVYRQLGAGEMDTPAVERRSLLQARYGEDHKLVYELADQGGEAACLRFDLTVPLMRVLRTTPDKNFRRYQVGKVYRRDQPSGAGVRLREFTQLDFDIVGPMAPMVAEAECIDAVVRCLTATQLGDCRVYLNDRRILWACVSDVGVTPETFPGVCSSLDKLDKVSWDVVTAELLRKGMRSEDVAVIRRRVSTEGTLSEMVPRIPDEALRREYAGLERYLTANGTAHRVRVTFTLARGLEYYDKTVFEIKKPEGGPSLGGGGCYDVAGTACVGVSLGLERLMEAGARAGLTPRCEVGVTVAPDAADVDTVARAFELTRMLRDQIDCDVPLAVHGDLRANLRRLKTCRACVIVFPDRLVVRDMEKRTQFDLRGIDNLVPVLRETVRLDLLES